jgi:hypothetical protein
MHSPQSPSISRSRAPNRHFSSPCCPWLRIADAVLTLGGSSGQKLQVSTSVRVQTGPPPAPDGARETAPPIATAKPPADVAARDARGGALKARCAAPPHETPAAVGPVFGVAPAAAETGFRHRNWKTAWVRLLLWRVAVTNACRFATARCERRRQVDREAGCWAGAGR